MTTPKGRRTMQHSIRPIVGHRTSWSKSACALALLCTVTAIVSRAQTFTTLANFSETNGPLYVSLVQGRDGKLYGTTFGGENDWGIVFNVTRTGTLTTLHSFCYCFDGGLPTAGLVLGTDGKFYGTTVAGGTYNLGNVFKITSGGVITTLHSFEGFPDGDGPQAALVLASNGNFYGTTAFGGSSATVAGSLFEISSAGTLNTLHEFAGYPTDGGEPYGQLIQATDGNFYGTTYEGGVTICPSYSPGCGTVFKITPGGTLTTLHTFVGYPAGDGAEPFGGLVQGSNGTFYGTTADGGANQEGTVFSITSKGTLAILHSFAGGDGLQPSAGLIQATDGNFYGTTYGGGAFGYGTVFKITPGGTLTTLHSFSDGTDGEFPSGGLVQATNGILYGTTVLGGTSGGGTIFSLDVGLGPFVTFVRHAGKVGQTAQILGQRLTGSTSVTFNGVAATSFSVASDTYMTAVVPAGATTGRVVVTTPSGRLTSNVNFMILK
jgi:uncharacterized repeat protein (TIGR03803 family)